MNLEKEVTNCCTMLADIVNLQDEAIQLATKVVGVPINEAPDEVEPDGSLAVVEMYFRTVERRMRLLVQMLNDLYNRV